MNLTTGLIQPPKRRFCPLNVVEVTVPPAMMPVSTALVKEWIRIDTDDTSQDAAVNMLIATAVRRVEQYANRSLITQTRRASFGYGDALVLPYTPVQSITLIQKQDTEGNWATVQPISYVNKGNGLIELSDYGVYRVTYVAGYGLTEVDVPMEAAAAIARLCKERYEFREGTIVEASSSKLDGLSWKAELSTIRIPTI